MLAADVAPRGSWTRAAFRLLGVDIERVEAVAATHHRRGVAAALAGVRTRPTKRNPDGVSRGALIRTCCRQHAVLRDRVVALQPVCCRQRACPACARARARSNATDLSRAIAERRRVAASMFLFATLTQPKLPRHRESPREATRRIVDAWRQLTNAKTALGRGFAARFVGGLRTTEVTFAARGDAREHGGVVAFAGYHAHLHVLIELRRGVARDEAAGWLQRAWLSLVPGAASAAQCVRPANEADAAQLCKYVTKPLEDVADKPAVLRELFGALHGVRMLQAFGMWMGRGEREGWRAWADGDDAPARPVVIRRGPEVGELLRYTTRRPEGATDRVPFRGVEPDDVVWVSSNAAWEAIQRAVDLRVAGRAPPG